MWRFSQALIVEFERMVPISIFHTGITVSPVGVCGLNGLDGKGQVGLKGLFRLIQAPQEFEHFLECRFGRKYFGELLDKAWLLLCHFEHKICHQSIISDVIRVHLRSRRGPYRLRVFIFLRLRSHDESVIEKYNHVTNNRPYHNGATRPGHLIVVHGASHVIHDDDVHELGIAVHGVRQVDIFVEAGDCFTHVVEVIHAD
ncbi:hypothetical protein E2C01_015747 [Portunus trituberculatus]|uniref:Uncharacterized protein n=1 Tax=Portunus trituberculatus TaxID=210409 RepID=A0A5B7DNN0_PORTR|nr:hypothetical protein [Portunus trituberculatus]